MRFDLQTLLVGVATVALLLGLNVPAKVETSRQQISPCVLVGYRNVPPGYEDRIPGPTAGKLAARRRLPNEMMSVGEWNLRRGWPLAFQHDRGFIYELAGGQMWHGLPDANPGAAWRRVSLAALALDCSLVILCMAVVQLALRCVRRICSPGKPGLFRGR